MISAKKLIKMAGKWQKLAALSRKRNSFPRNVNDDLNAASTSSIHHHQRLMKAILSFTLCVALIVYQQLHSERAVQDV